MELGNPLQVHQLALAKDHYLLFHLEAVFIDVWTTNQNVIQIYSAVTIWWMEVVVKAQLSEKTGKLYGIGT